MNRRYPDLEARILANSVLSLENYWRDPDTGLYTPCWEWTGAFKTNDNGKKYPVMAIRVPGVSYPVSTLVTRKVLEVFKGLRMTKIHVAAHRCNYTPCINPDHLRRDTQSGNIQQAHDEGRAYNRRTWVDGSRGYVAAY